MHAYIDGYIVTIGKYMHMFMNTHDTMERTLMK